MVLFRCLGRTVWLLLLVYFAFVSCKRGRHQSFHPKKNAGLEAQKIADFQSSKCDNAKCKNDALCIPNSTNVFGYSCRCPTGFVGQFCEIEKSGCDPNPCQAGECITTDAGYKCVCQGGYSGMNCSVKEQLVTTPSATPSDNANGTALLAMFDDSATMVMAGMGGGSLLVFVIGCWIFHNALVDKRKYLAEQKRKLGDDYTGPEPNCCCVCLDLMCSCFKGSSDNASGVRSRSSVASRSQASGSQRDFPQTPPRTSSLGSANSGPGQSRNNHNRAVAAYPSMTSSNCTSATAVTGSSISRSSLQNSRQRSYERYVYGAIRAKKDHGLRSQDEIHQALIEQGMAARRSLVTGQKAGRQSDNEVGFCFTDRL